MYPLHFEISVLVRQYKKVNNCISAYIIFCVLFFEVKGLVVVGRPQGFGHSGLLPTLGRKHLHNMFTICHVEYSRLVYTLYLHTYVHRYLVHSGRWMSVNDSLYEESAKILPVVEG